MSRKHKRHRRAPAPATTASPDPVSTAAQADTALRVARFKDAVRLFKELLKREHRPVWIEGLAAAYAGRAKDLAAKGMVKEAVALWRTRAQSCGKTLLDADYIEWLMQTGATDEALRLLVEAAVQAPPTTAPLAAKLAALMLWAPDEVAARLPADNALARHRDVARQAVEDCSRGNFASMAARLKTIPFRSPYRDLKPILNALTALIENRAEAHAAITRLPVDGPFEPLAAAVRTAALTGDAWIAALRGLDDESRVLVFDLKGCPEEQRPFFYDLAKLGDTPTPRALLDLLLRHRRRLPGAEVQRLGLRLLPHAPERLKTYNAAFGPLAPAEQERVYALAAELHKQYDHAVHHWVNAANMFERTGEHARQAAMILRRLACDRNYCELDDPLDEDAVEWLGQSVDLDPGDRDGHLKLIQTLRERSDLKRARHYCETASARFPGDAAVLTEEVETALASGAYKKAARLAKRILQSDPINVRVRSVLGNAHLSHARKQIKAHSTRAACRELDEARQWLRSPVERGVLKLLLALTEESVDTADRLLREGVADLGGPLVGAFHLGLEAHRLGTGATALLRRAGFAPGVTPAPEQIVALAQILNAAPPADRAISTALDPFRAVLARGATAEYAETDHLLICEALLGWEEHDLAGRYATAALKRWPRRPVFVFLRAVSNYGGKPWSMPRKSIDELERAHAAARSAGDQRTVARIENLLDQISPRFAAPGMLPGDDVDFGDPRELVDPMISMLGADGFLRMVRKQIGRAAFNDLRQAFGGGSDQQFARHLGEVLAQLGLLPVLPPAGPPFPAPEPNNEAKRRPKRPPGQQDMFDE